MFGQLNLKHVNRFASLAIIPLMALALVVGSRLASDSPKATAPPREGTLIVADLRGESLRFFQLETSRQSDLALPGPPHEFVVVDGRLYVTLGRANAVAEVEPKAPGILRLLHLDGEPHGIALGPNGNLFVTLDTAAALVEVDRRSFTEIGRTPTGNTPHAVAFGGLTAYVTDSRANRVEALLDGAASAPTGALPESLAVTSQYVVTADAGAGTLSVFRRQGLQLARSIQVGGHPVRVVALDTRRVLVSLNADGRVLVVNVETGKIERSLAAGGHPDGLCLSPDGDFLAVGLNEDRAVAIFRTSDWQRVTAMDAGQGPGSCAWTGLR